MKVAEIMSKEVCYFPPSSTLKEAAQKMSNRNIGFLPIGENDRLIGALTDRDMVVRGIAEEKDFYHTTVKEILTDKILYCYEDDELENAVKNMAEQKVRRLVVLDRDKRLTGVLSLADVAKKCNDENLLGRIFKTVAESMH